VARRHGDQPHEHHADDFREVRRLVDERDAPLGEVDDRRDHERAGEHTGDRQHRAGPGRAGDDDQQPDPVGDGEGAEVPGRMGRRLLLLAQQGRNGHDDDLDGDDRQQRPNDAPRGCPVGERSRPGHASGEVGQRYRGDWRRRPRRDGRGELLARPTPCDVGVEKAFVDAKLLAVGPCRDGLAPPLTRHGGQVA
jgi:hypothetical protein